MNTRPSLDQLGLGMGKKARLHRILHEHGAGNGTAIFLPYDHGLEHGPRDFAGYPESGDPRHVIRLAVEGGFNGVALQIGLAGKFYWEYAGEVPLVLKLNGKTDIPSPADPVSPVNATVEEAVRLGADAVSGGEHAGQEAMLEKARESMEAGATGLIFGRNVFQRSHDESLRFVTQLKEILAKYPS